MPKHRSSTNFARLATLAAGLALMTPATTVAAQTQEQRRLDSLTVRLEDAEDVIEMLRQQLATKAESGVRTRSRVAFELSGRVLMNVFSNSKETNNADVPMYRMQVPDDSPKGGMGMSIRQTVLTGAVTAHDILGGTFRGDIDVDFFGGQMPSAGGRTFPLMRIRTARAIVDWERSQLLIGQEQPLVSGLNPLSLAAVGAPNFSYSGNLWLWLPQIRYGVHTTGRLRTGIQGAILAPTSGDPADIFDTGFDAAERTNMPYLQARAHVGWGRDETRAEVGVGYHYGQVNDANDEAQASNAITLDFLVPFGSRLEMRGEAFSGQVLNGLGGGGIGQNFSPATGVTPVRSLGAWTQVNYRVSPRWLIGAGYGFEDPNDDDLIGAGVKLSNVTQEFHVHWRPAGPLVLGLEWRSVTTKYDASNYGNQHINLAFGFEF